ncbi:MAG: TetR/AcrR family transcriptional regulator [Gracilibacteraceae bacterium]|jgi:AcrR family transcriptional regulator|nr:TetR/AcrR family transcriptional regulator [Gracilibacteraceae bacterium]
MSADKEDKKHRIFDAARELFYNRGFAETTMQEIAESAGLGKGTLYGYFLGKEHLFRELLQYDETRQINIITERLHENTAIRPKLLQMAEFQLAILERQYRLLNDARRYSICPDSWREDIDGKKRKWASLLEETVRQAMADGEIRADIPVGAAMAALFGSFSFYCFFWMILEKERPSTADLEELFDIIMDGLAG